MALMRHFDWLSAPHVRSAR